MGDLAYRSEALGRALAECGISLLCVVSERADQHGQRQRIEIALSSLKGVFGLGERSSSVAVASQTTPEVRADVALAALHPAHAGRVEAHLLGEALLLTCEVWQASIAKSLSRGVAASG